MTLLPFDDPISPGEVAQHLKRMRKLAGMTQREAATRQGWSLRTIAAYEQGRNLDKFCAILALFESYGCVVVFRAPKR